MALMVAILTTMSCDLIVCPSPSGPLSDMAPYEMIRSRELNAILGPKGSPEAVDLVCDLHNTTANMGLCLIAYSDCDWICLHIFRHLQASRNASYTLQSNQLTLACLRNFPQWATLKWKKELRVVRLET